MKLSDLIRVFEDSTLLILSDAKLGVVTIAMMVRDDIHELRVRREMKRIRLQAEAAARVLGEWQ